MKTEAFMRRFGKFVDSLNGKYITAEDVNMKTADMEYIGMETKHVTGLPESMRGGGDPSPVTAYGVYLGGMKSRRKKSLKRQPYRKNNRGSGNRPSRYVFNRTPGKRKCKRIHHRHRGR